MWHLLADAVMTNPSPFEWASNHLHIIGWPVLVYLAWQAGNFFRDFKTQVTKTVAQIDQMAVNHFPHMEASLSKQDSFLASIDKNIGRMADKL